MIYMPQKEAFVSDEINFGDFFNMYSCCLKDRVNVCCKSLLRKFVIRRILNIEDSKYKELSKDCSLIGFKPRADSEQLVIPIEGFRSDFLAYKVPPDLHTLKSINALRKRTNKDKIVLSKKLRYIGEKDLEDKIVRAEEEKHQEDMLMYKEFLLTVRVYLPAKHRSFLQSGDKTQRPRPLHVSQEFLIPGGATLDSLRDRIICQGDFQSIEGDVSTYPWTETTVRTMDVFKSAMFYIGNKFYIDRRFDSCKDYSAPVIEWGKKRNIKFDGVEKMEDTYLCQLKLRLGYPYVYIHLSNCEHIIIFTDARLLHFRDVQVYSSYPIMKSYANLRGRYCKICKRRLAKYIVVESDRLPYSKMFICTYCLFLYNYKGYAKVGNFKAYKYVDRIALL